VAHARRHDFDQHFAGAGAIEIKLDDFERFFRLKRNSGAGFHGRILPGDGNWNRPVHNAGAAGWQSVAA
jgi:hypothetical protein